MIDVWINDFPGKKIYLQRLPPPEIVSQLSFLHIVEADVLAAMKDLAEPLAVDLALSCSMEEPGLEMVPESAPIWFSQLRVLEPPPRVELRTQWVGSDIATVPRIDLDAITAWTKKAFEPGRSAGMCSAMGWNELWFSANRVRLPISASSFAGSTLFARGFEVGEGDSTYIVERRDETVWVSEIGTCCPWYIRVDNDFGFVSLTISLRWSLWSGKNSLGWPVCDEYSARGAREIEAVVDRLMTRGWVHKT